MLSPATSLKDATRVPPAGTEPTHAAVQRTRFFEAQRRIPQEDYKGRSRAFDRFLVRQKSRRFGTPPRRFSALELLVLTEITIGADSTHRRCWCGPTCLMERTHAKRRPIERALSVLEKADAIASMRAEGPDARPGERWYVPILDDADRQGSAVVNRAEKESQAHRRRLKRSADLVANAQYDLLTDRTSPATLADDPSISPATLADDPLPSPATLAGDPPSTHYICNLDSPTKSVDPTKPATRGAAADSELAGSNDAVGVMISDIVAWMPGCDQRSARLWLETTLRLYGQAITRDGYAKLKADLASGSPVARPLQTWVAIAKRLKDEPARPAGAALGNRIPTWEVKRQASFQTSRDAAAFVEQLSREGRL